MSYLDELYTLKSEIDSLAKQFGAVHVRVFGSVSREEEHADSDVDFLIDLLPGHGLLDQGGLLMALTDLLGRPVDVFTEQSLKQEIRQTVLRDAKPL